MDIGRMRSFVWNGERSAALTKMVRKPTAGPNIAQIASAKPSESASASRFCAVRLIENQLMRAASNEAHR